MPSDKKSKKDKKSRKSGAAGASASSSGATESLTLRFVNSSAAPLGARFPCTVPDDDGGGAASDGVLGAASSAASLYQPSNTRKKRQRMLVVQHAASDALGRKQCVAFEGRDFPAHSTGDKAHAYLVGVVDRATGTVELRAIPHLFEMAQRVRVEGQGAHTRAFHDETDVAQYQRLTEAFGSRKTKMKLKTKASNKVRVENISGGAAVGKILERKAAAAAEAGVGGAANDPSAHALMETRRQFLPPFNEHAINPTGVYAPRALVTAEEWAALEAVRDDLLDQMEAAEAAEAAGEGGEGKGGASAVFDQLKKGRTPPFLMEALRPLLVSAARQRQAGAKKGKKRARGAGFDDGDESEDEEEADNNKVLLLLHMKCLFKFFNFKFPMRKKSAAEIAEFAHVPLPIVRRVLSEFADGKNIGTEDVSFARTREQKERLLMFILAEALYVHNACLRHATGTAIAAELSMTTMKLNRYLKEMGCQIERLKAEDVKEEPAAGKGKAKAKSGAAYDARLICPVTFPTNTRGI